MEQSQQGDSTPEGNCSLEGKIDDPGGVKENSPERSTDQVEDNSGKKTSSESSNLSSIHLRSSLQPRYSKLRVVNSDISGLQRDDGNDADSGTVSVRRSVEEKSKRQQTIHLTDCFPLIARSPTSGRRHCPGSPTHSRTKYGSGSVFGKGDGKVKNASPLQAARRSAPKLNASWTQNNGHYIYRTWSSRNTAVENEEGTDYDTKGATTSPRSPQCMNIILKPPVRRELSHSSTNYLSISAPTEENYAISMRRSESNPTSPTSWRATPSPFPSSVVSDIPSSSTPLSTPMPMQPSRPLSSLFSLCTRGIHITHSVNPEEVSAGDSDNVMHMTISTTDGQAPSLHVTRSGEDVNGEVKPAEEVKSVEEVKPMEEVKPGVEEEKSTKEVKPAEEVNEGEDDMYWTLIDTGNEGNTLQLSSPSQDYLFEGLDLSSPPQQSDVMIPPTQEDDEKGYAEMDEKFDEMMREEQQEREEIGEEVQGGEVSSDEYFLGDGHMDIEKEKKSEETDEPSVANAEEEEKGEEEKNEEKEEEKKEEEEKSAEEEKNEEKAEEKSVEEEKEEKEEEQSAEEDKTEEEEKEEEREETEEGPKSPWRTIDGNVISMTISDLISVADTSLHDLFPAPPSPPPLPEPSQPAPPAPPAQPLEKTPSTPAQPAQPLEKTPSSPPLEKTPSAPLAQPAQPAQPTQPLEKTPSTQPLDKTPSTQPLEPTPEEEEKREQLRAQARADLTAFHAARQKRREALRQQRQRQPATDYRLVEFRNLFGDCTALLLPFVRVIDYTLGPLIQPTDPLLNVVEVVYRRIEEGAADESVLAQEAEKAGAKTVEEKRAWVVKAVKESRFMQCHLASFVFYYECALRYMAKKVTSELNFSC